MSNKFARKSPDAPRLVPNTRIVGVACALPARISKVSELAATFGEEAVNKIIASTGIEARHVSDDECTSDLCLKAAESLFADLSIDRSTIDALIFVTQTPDYRLPATACTLQRRLGLDITTAAFDVSLGCSGYVYGLWLASSLLAGGGSRRVLLLAGDTVSKIVAKSDRSVAALFGDAGSATLLEYHPDAVPTPYILGTDGRGERNLVIPSGGFRDIQGSDLSTSEEGLRGPCDLFMNGAEIFAFTLARVPGLVRDLQSAAEKQNVKIDKYVFHQANKFMLDHLAKKMRLDPNDVVVNLKDVGNTSAASIPLALCLNAEAQQGLCGNYLLAGFGVGYSWAGCIVNLSDTQFSHVVRVSSWEEH
ncbi:3-oxoacyl-ACP synthase [Pseudomonas amygdali pv. morsprunorum]|uniref:3-oxoacyl-ACP synthase n=6 Tax=Pseudomonas syringae group TaxID=136849 RepID=A0A0P9R5P0_PSEA0|nr:MULTISPECIES: ketoacyl-ACP synthase III [Pseudomonas syringae group]KPB53252.1 putative 3-oxoacyl-[acyl-carrier-protein] synthase III [Pseudomonas amygdali pv. myricae]PPS33739.1 3-oxoacyl-ACP synthase [Pseudomonas amygdali pv. morsprunorum]KPX13304.1 hypothetical protein ALO71_102669 [Pseudomonas amygdali pv. dendropanacis]KPX14022.1 putative 3-oxoacyl- synthase III [Pseudomonas syringae pv. daphniphylli]KPX23513.1 putative 3-oxoacyl- synthase III [Pseudomonas amygdali pv. eriobotryae]